MATNKQINSRLQLKHDIEANWITAGENGFIPLAGEVIIYDKDDNHECSRIKIGDGTTNVNELSFSGESDWNAAEGEPGHVLNRTHWDDRTQYVNVVVGTYGVTTITTPNFVFEGYNGSAELDNTLKLKHNQKVVLTVDGTSYDALVYAVNSEDYVLVPSDFTVDNPNTFFDNNKFRVSIEGSTLTLDHIDNGGHSIIISGGAVHKLPTRFLPEGVPYAIGGGKPTNTLTFDGDLADKQAIQINTGTFGVNIYNEYVDTSELLGGTVKITSFTGESESYPITEDMIMDAADMGIDGYVIADAVLVARNDFTMQGVSVPKGITVIYVSGQMYVSEIEVPANIFTIEEIRKLDNRCLDLAWTPIDPVTEIQLAAEKTVTNTSTPNITEIEGGFPDMTINDVYIGMPLIVCVDGVRYECIVAENPTWGIVAMNANMPIWLTFRDDRTDVSYSDHNMSYVASVYAYEKKSNPMPHRFLPEGVPYAHMDMVLPECQPEYIEDENIFLLIENAPPFVMGKTYIVNWNNTEYTCVGQDLSAMMAGAVGLGDLSSVMGGASTGEPFIIASAYQDGEQGLVMVPLDGTTELTLSIKGKIVRKIDPACLPDGVPYIEGGMVEILPKTHIEEAHAGYEFPEPFGFVEGKIYKVIWNGTSYECPVFTAEEEGLPVFGIGDPDVRDTYPFSIVDVPEENRDELGFGAMLTCDDMEADVSIYTEGEIHHPIPSELLPGDVFNKDAVFGLTKKQTEMLPETNVEFGHSIKQRHYDELPLEELNPGKYIVYWRGVPYECAVQYATGSINDLTYKRTVLGNVSKLKGTAFDNIDGINMNVDSGEPFVINAIFVQGMSPNALIHRFDNEEYTEETIPVQIFLIEDEVNKMPIKYLPEGVPYCISGDLTDTLTFDGNIEGKTAIEVDTDVYFVNISNNYVEPSKLIGSVVTLTDLIDGFENDTYEITEDMIIDGSEMGASGYGIGEFCIILSEDFTKSGVTIPKGINVMCVPGALWMNEVKATSKIFESIPEIRKLDNRCLDLEWLPVKKTDKGTVLVPEQVSSNTMGYLRDANYEALHAGITEIIVTVDGVEHIYPVTIEETESPNYGYNIQLVTVGSSFESMPFAMQYRPNQTSENFAFSLLFKDGQTVSVHIAEQVVNKLPEEFLPESVPYVEKGVMTEIPIEGEWSTGGGEFNFAAPFLELGKKYIITWERTGAVYEDVARRDRSYISLGDYDDTRNEYPFWIYQTAKSAYLAIANDGQARDPFSIKVVNEVPHKLDTDLLPDSVPFVKEAALLEEAEAVSFTHPEFGTLWAVYHGTPNLTVGETYTITYNETPYECVCQAAPAGLIEDPNAVAMGNFSVVGGANTGEPFAILVSFAYQEVDIIDLVGSSAVTVGITGKVVQKIDSLCLPDDIGGGDASAQIEAHNTSAEAHSDIRSSISNLSTLVGNTKVSEQISAAIEGLATETYVDNAVLITAEEIDAICGTTIQLASEVLF